MLLETTTYSALHGYSWSSVPTCATLSKLDQLYRMISAARGDFPDPLNVEIGLVSDGMIAAAFTIQNVEHWDSESRASDYAAFALFPVDQAAEIDLVDLLNNDFFWTPSRKPADSLEYSGKTAANVSQQAVEHLLINRRTFLRNPRAIGSLLAACGKKSSRWVCLMKGETLLKVECNSLT